MQTLKQQTLNEGNYEVYPRYLYCLPIPKSNILMHLIDMDANENVYRYPDDPTYFKCPANDLAKMFGMTWTTMDKHLNDLKAWNFIDYGSKTGKNIIGGKCNFVQLNVEMLNLLKQQYDLGVTFFKDNNLIFNNKRFSDIYELDNYLYKNYNTVIYKLDNSYTNNRQLLIYFIDYYNNYSKNRYKNSSNNSKVKKQVSSNETTNNKSKEITKVSKEVYDYFNQTLGTNYKYNVKGNKDRVKKLLDSGYTLEDIKTVIDKKTKQWKNDPKMKQFLTPSTLLGDKFDTYLNQEVYVNPESKLSCKSNSDMSGFKPIL